MKKEKKIFDATLLNKRRCIVGLIMGFIMFSLVFVGLILNVANYYNEDAPEAGLGTLRMFTTLSNILVGCGALLTIPFQIEGLRRNNYHLPRWIVDVLYIGTLGVALTFLTSITAITFSLGFYEAMVSKSNLFMHTINPIMAIILLTFINCDHHISFPKSFIPLIPIGIYAIMYYIMGIAIGEDKGGWRDVYNFNTFLPWYISLVLVFMLAFLLSNLLRYLHNIKHRNFKELISRFYRKSPIFEANSIEEAIRTFAEMKSNDYVGGDISIPTRILQLFKERYDSDKTTNELSSIYINHFLKLIE